MNILNNIRNRSENWKTVQHFYGLSKEVKERLAKQLLANHCGTTPSQVDLGSNDVHIQLFWKGMRDYVHDKSLHKNTWDKKFADVYKCMFPDLREFARQPKYRFQELQKKNYDVSKPGYWPDLYSNLINTEIDVVLETSDYLLIGEAKCESKLRGSGKYVLVHQLIRQYVMARILLKTLSSGNDTKEVVPFIVGPPSIRNHGQVELMIDKRWLKEENILTWEEIKKLSGCS